MTEEKFCIICKNKKTDIYWYQMPVYSNGECIKYIWAHKNCADDEEK